MRSALLGGLLALVLTCTSACWFGRDYSECAGDGDCHVTQRCTDAICVFRAGVARCLAGRACPEGTSCDETLFVCVAGDAGGAGDASDGGGDDAVDDAGADPPMDSAFADGDAADLPTVGDLTSDLDAPGERGHDDCDDTAECDLGGPPECRLGDPPEVVADPWSCTFDGCDERGRIFHTPSSALCDGVGACERTTCDPAGQNTDDGSGCRVDVLPIATPCGADRVCRGRDCIDAGCGNGVVELARDEECEGALVGEAVCQGCHWVPSTLDLASAPPPGTRIAAESGDALRLAACVDLDGDGVDDVVLTSATVGRVDVFFGPLSAGELSTADRAGRLRATQALDVAVGALDVASGETGLTLVARRDDGGLYLYSAQDLRGADLVVSNETARASVGIGRDTVAAMGLADVDGDGAAEVLVSYTTELGGHLGAYDWSPDGGLVALPGELRGGAFVSREFGSGGAIAYAAGGGGYWVSDPAEQLSPIDETAPGAAYRMPPVWRSGRVGDGASLRVIGSGPGARVRAAAVLGAPSSGEEAVVFVEPAGRVYAAGASALIADFELSDDPAAGLAVWAVASTGVEAVRAADVTGDGRDDLVIADAGALLGRGTHPGRLRVAPWPLPFGRLVDFDREPAPFEIIGFEDAGLTGAVSCDVDGDGVLEVGLILEGASGIGGEVRFYDTLPWTRREE